MIEIRDIKLAQQGDEEATEKIFHEYQNSILRNNRKFFLKGAESDDLLQEGYIGLMKAIKSYDETKNACFNTFANLCIRRQIITAVKTHSSAKYQNLNSAVMGEEYVGFEEVTKYNAPSINFYNPEEIVLGKELVKLLETFLVENLSDLEKKVFYYLCKEYTYIEIAETLDESPKKIDNTIQRIKKKILNYLGTYVGK
ncbi:sigma-70 family RNA polymerase sigma factor [uncultured Cetobacterium sp.]|uniref:sigma-70 family RNA polymerase sigma factor n=1 Tax=uncultured Cetobacterium sp. TaxID=527638 RepID=UPI00262F99DC|nr:sigma-70 family RNA polymerase sigma factor [uncultured Cetobacterium sp.]